MRKVAVIGMGNVGAAVAHQLVVGGYADELYLYDKNEACRMVITAISLETLAAVTAYYAARNGYQLDITQVSAARSKRVGQHHLMMAQNPVYIMTAVRQDAGEA